MAPQETKNLYLLWQTKNNGYDTYDSCVVCATSVEEAIKIRPDGEETTELPERWDTWVGLKDVKVAFIGTASAELLIGVICASFNAG